MPIWQGGSFGGSPTGNTGFNGGGVSKLTPKLTGGGLPDFTQPQYQPEIPQPTNAPRPQPTFSAPPPPAPVEAAPRKPTLPAAPAPAQQQPEAPAAVQSLLAMSGPQEPAEGFVGMGPAGPLNPNLGRRTPPDAVRILSQLTGGAY